MKKIISLLLCFVIIISVCSCADITDSETSAHEKEEFSINIPDMFEDKTEGTGYAALYVYSDVYVWAIKDAFSGLDGSVNWELDYYANTIHMVNEQNSPKPLYKENGLTLMEYTVFNESKNKTFTYLTSMYKGSDAFWMVQFVCEDKNFEEYKPSFIEWAESVKVK